MNKKPASAFFVHNQWLIRLVLSCAFSAIYAFIMLLLVTPTYAEAIPGGNIANPVIRAVDIAKPAVVRIITTLGGRLTVLLPNNKTAVFPLSGGTYQIQASGSGAFISAHGDILTADHVIQPPHDATLNQFVEQEAAQDVAAYVNENLNPKVFWKSQDALNALNSGYFLSQAYYTNPISKVYLSTDYTGPIQATNLQNLPSGISAEVDRVEADSPADQKDLAIIHIKMDDTPSIPLDDSSNVAQQDELTIIGFPANGDISTTGDPTDTLTSSINKVYVSALKYTDTETHVIQVGGNIEHGDSGGPALDSSGHIVGVVSFEENVSTPEGTGFLQISNNATGLISTLGLDLKAGNLEKEWNQAFSDYTSTVPGHWHKAQTEFQHLSNTYQGFHAVEPFLTYTKNQASKEQLPEHKQSQINFGLILSIVAICLGILIVVLLLTISIKRKKRQQAPASTVLLQPTSIMTQNGAPMTPFPIMQRTLNNSDQESANTESLEIALHNETTVKGITEKLRAIESAKSTLDG